eukprot:NODE_635_length_5742_cov_0.308701.p2 type:complete len:285 gc:universal NODE_635_length_5742_cov_0.308701:3819-2965(-)
MIGIIILTSLAFFLIMILVVYAVTPELPNITSTNLYKKSSTTLSVIIPCYNESDRLHLCTDDIIKSIPYCKIPLNEIEFIFVNDGSNDDTLVKLNAIKLKYKNWNVVVLDIPKNKGKGYGVRHGMSNAKGDYCMYMDCDAAASFSCVEIIWDPKCDVVIGSRAHLSKESKAKRSPFRSILMYGFHLFVYIFGVKTIKDTQCGFKMFKRKAAQVIFKNARIDRFLFDVELILIAEYFGLKIKEVGIPWQEVDGSKMSFIRDSLKMAVDLLILRFGIMFKIRSINK